MRGTERPAGGVLHGLFVFACVAYALQILVDLGRLDGKALHHARRRIREIRDEFDVIDYERLRTALTAHGNAVQLVARRAVEHRSPALTHDD